MLLILVRQNTSEITILSFWLGWNQEFLETMRFLIEDWKKMEIYAEVGRFLFIFCVIFDIYRNDQMEIVLKEISWLLLVRVEHFIFFIFLFCGVDPCCQQVFSTVVLCLHWVLRFEINNILWPTRLLT